MFVAMRLIRGRLGPWIMLAALVLFFHEAECSATDDSPFSLINQPTRICFMKRSRSCLEVRWTTGNRLFATSSKKCVGAQGKSVGSEVNLYDCNDKSDLQKWECRNGTLLALKAQELYIEVRSDESVALTKTPGSRSQFTITGTPNGACTRTYRELYSIEGNAFGKVCMFPFLYKDRWFGDCTTYDSSVKRSWCAVETKYDRELWGYCPTTSTQHWTKNIASGAYYQLNTQSALTWAQADKSCKQQAASLVSIIDPGEQAIISALVGKGKTKLWLGLVLDLEHGWKWTDGRPYRYLRWDSGNPRPNPGHNCAFYESSDSNNWQSSSCDKKLGYICYKDGAPLPTPHIEQGFCASPWIPYNGHCFHLHRTVQTWSGAQRECRKEGGELVSIRNVEDQSFVISQLGYASNDELWIGLNDRKIEGLFDWSDQSTVTFTSWEYGKPTVFIEDQDCVLIRGQNGNWADRSCDEKHGFICMKQSSTEGSESTEDEIDVGCKLGWKKHGSYCYFVGTETKTFDEAKDDCRNSDSYLADVSNGVDNAFLISLVGSRPEKYFWLGLSNQNNIDVFVWTNTISVRFTHWNAGMPGHEQGCVAITTGIFAGLWDVLPCTNKEKYICKKQAEGVLPTVPPPTQAPLKCEEGWSRIGTRNTCAKFFAGSRSEEKTWFEARDYCRAIGGDLLSIHSEAELQVFKRRGGTGWIGLNMPDPNTGYVWSDGTPVNFQHWQEGEPNNFNEAESCVEMIIHSWVFEGSWNDANCESYKDWVCQIRAGLTPKPPPNNTVTEYNTTADGWIEWRGNQYFIHSQALAKEEARHFCQKRHGDLASIHSREENTFIWKQISRSYGYYYIGLSVDLDGSFWWMDGTTVSFQSWNEKQSKPIVFDVTCVFMSYYMGFWETSNCGRELQFICKRRGSAPVNTTVAPTEPPTGGCPFTWTKFGKKCYNVKSDQRATWEDARKHCINIRGTLVSIPTRSVQAFLVTKMNELATSDLWIGWKYRRFGFFYQTWNEEDCVVLANGLLHESGKWIVKSCNDTYGFICQKNIDKNVPDHPESVDSSVYVRLRNDSFKVVLKNLTWDMAKKNCEADKANLVSQNEWTKAYEILTLNSNASLWIGLNKDQTKGYFRYTDGWHLSSANWAELEPSNDKPCVYIDVDGKWRTSFCNRTMNSVCMQSTDVPPTESSIFPGRCPEQAYDALRDNHLSWTPHKGHCYLFITNEIEWPHAASSCAQHGAVLASIADPDEQQFIKTNLEKFQGSHQSFWIGFYQTHKGTWLWLDQSTVDFTYWDPDEPDAQYGSVRTSDGVWTSGRGWHDKPYICKTPKVTSTDPEGKPEPQVHPDSRSRVHTSLVVVLIIAITSTLIAVAFFLYKKSPRPLPTFENPLYFNSEKSPPDVVDTNKLIENAENLEPILTL
ncbi:LOW QUALITY PROTEIN: macrophage mannose receptor 1-like [Pholidichthys leucotaenia]